MDDIVIEEGEKTNFFKYLVAFFLIGILILMLIPYSWIDEDLRPEYIPLLEEVRNGLKVESVRLETINDVEDVFVSNELKVVASKIASGCEYGGVCYAKSFFYFTRDEINYISDPSFEFVEDWGMVLNSGSADCDGKSVFLVSMFKAVGILSRVVLVHGHAYVQVYLPEALNKYKFEGEWVNLDASCRGCEFGEVDISYLENIIDYVYVG